MPSAIGVEQATGFGLWLTRAVIDGRGAEIVDLARTNLWRRARHGRPNRDGDQIR